MRHITAMILITCLLGIPRAVESRPTALVADSLCMTEAYAGRRFLEITADWFARLRSGLVERPDDFLVHISGGVLPRWEARPELQLELEARSEQLKTSPNLATLLGRNLDVIVGDILEAARFQHIVAGQGTPDSLRRAADSMIGSVATVEEGIAAALSGLVFELIQAPPAVVTDPGDDAWKLIVPPVNQEEGAVDYSRDGRRLREVAGQFLPKLQRFALEWQDAVPGSGERESAVKALAAEAWSGDSFDINVRLELMARLIEVDPSSAGAVYALADALSERFRNQRFYRTVKVGVCVAGATVLLAVAAGTTAVALPVVKGGLTKAGVGEAMLLVVLKTGRMVATTSGMALLHTAFRNSHRDPLDVVDLIKRRSIETAVLQRQPVEVTVNDEHGSNPRPITDPLLPGADFGDLHLR